MKYFVAVLLSLILFGSTSAQEKIDINTAPLQDLIKIVHIGETRAQELISLRPFLSLDDLTRINGIGPSRLQDIKNQGLAWVSDEDLAEDRPPLSQSEIVAPETEIRLAENEQDFRTITTAGLLAVLSGAGAVLLKRKTEI